MGVIVVFSYIFNQGTGVNILTWSAYCKLGNKFEFELGIKQVGVAAVLLDLCSGGTWFRFQKATNYHD
jgi:hypothetical protein